MSWAAKTSFWANSRTQTGGQQQAGVTAGPCSPQSYLLSEERLIPPSSQGSIKRQAPHRTLRDARVKPSRLVMVLPTSPLVAAAHGSQGGQWPGMLPKSTTPESLSQPHGLPAKSSTSISHGAHCVEMERVPASTDGKLQQQQKCRDHNYLSIMKGFIKYTWKTTQQPHKVKLLVSTLQTI